MKQCFPENYSLINSLETAVLGLMILVIMFGMGAGLTVQSFSYVLKKPKGVLIGFLSQFGWMPAIGFLLGTVLGLPALFAIALILVGSIPGGTTSNLFTYFSRGNVALSITMTVCSTVAAIILTPLMLEIYASGFASQVDLTSGKEFKIPFKSIIQSLILVIVPVLLGLLLRRFRPGAAKAAEDTAGFMGVLVILFLIVMFLLDPVKRCLMAETPFTVYLASIGIGLAGFTLGYIASRALKMIKRDARSVSLETGIQNGPLAFAIVLLSFSDGIGKMDLELASSMLWLPILYSFFIVVTSSFITMFYRRIGKHDSAIYENREVQKNLFGDSWQPLED